MNIRSANSNRTAIVAASLVCAAASTSAFGQWSHDPAVNTGISVGGSDQNQAKSLPTGDGGWYVVWLDGIGTGWDTRLQRYNSRGIAQWADNGVLVADTAFSSTQDYGFAVDALGNAIVAYRDDANNGSPVQIKVQKIDPTGALLWGAGVQVSTVAGGNAPHVCATSDNGAVVGWTGSGVLLQKVSAKGSVVWTAGGVTDTLASGTPSLADVCAGDNGGAIALYIKGSLPRHLFTRKFDSTGAKVWNSATTPVALFDEAANGVQIAATIYIQSDGAGGAYYAWYATGGTRNAYAQHINSAGTEVFPHNGVTVADDAAGRIRISSAISIDSSNGDIYMIAKESNASPQGSYNAIAQRLDATGARLWGSTGVTLFSQGADQPTFAWVQALSGGNGAIFTWDNGGFNSQKVFVSRVNAAGAFAWTPGVLDVCSTLSGKGRLWISGNTAGSRALITWADNRNAGTNDIFGQVVNADGSLGNPGDVNDDGVVNVADLLAVISTWGACPGAPTFCAPDLATAPRGDGQVNVADLLNVITNWG